MYCHKSQHRRTFIKNCFIVQTCDQSEMAQCLSHAVIIPPCISCVAPHLHRMQISRTEHKDSIRIETNFFIFFLKNFFPLLIHFFYLLLGMLSHACIFYFILYIFLNLPKPSPVGSHWVITAKSAFAAVLLAEPGFCLRAAASCW